MAREVNKMNKIRRQALYLIFRKSGYASFAKLRYFKFVKLVTSVVARFNSF